MLPEEAGQITHLCWQAAQRTLAVSPLGRGMTEALSTELVHGLIHVSVRWHEDLRLNGSPSFYMAGALEPLGYVVTRPDKRTVIIHGYRPPNGTMTPEKINATMRALIEMKVEIDGSDSLREWWMRHTASVSVHTDQTII